MVQPLKKVKVIHKHKGKFIRHQSDTNVSVKVSAAAPSHGFLRSLPRMPVHWSRRPADCRLVCWAPAGVMEAAEGY